VVKKIFQRSPISVLLSFVGVLFLQNATAASPPVIGGVSPNSGPESQDITIWGTNFESGAKVYINGSAPRGLWQSGTTHLTLEPPLSKVLGAVDVEVVNPNGGTATLKGGFSYTTASLAPAPAPTPTPTPTPAPSPAPVASTPACTKYASPSGSVSGNTAYRTIQAGVNALVAGDTLCVGAGTYHEQIVMTKSGTAAKPITIRSFDSSNKAVIDGQYSLPTGATSPSGCTTTTVDRVAYPHYACTNINFLVQISASYVTWNGINVVHSLGMGVFIGDGTRPPMGYIGTTAPCCNNYTNLQFIDSSVSHTRLGGIMIFYADAVLFSGNDVYDTNNYAAYDNHVTPSGMFLPWGNGLNVIGTNITVTNNTFHQQFCEPIQVGSFVVKTYEEPDGAPHHSSAFRSANNIVIKNNVFYDNWAMEGPYLGNINVGVVDSNLIYSSGDSTYFRSGVPQVCLAIDSETGNGSNNLVISNNIISNCYSLVKMQQYDPTSSYADFSFYNNTLLNPYPGGDVIENNMTNLTGFSFFNNLSYAPQAHMNSTQYSASQGGAVNGNFKSIPEFSAGNNIWSSQPSANILGAGDRIVVSPGLADPSYRPAASTPATFDVDASELLSGSAAINDGKHISTVTADYFGTPRPASGAYDVGAYQH